MTNEQKKLIAGYMGWKKAYLSNGYHNILYNRPVVFDLNDAGLVVKEMLKRGDWDEFFYFVWNGYRKAEKLLYKEVDEAKFTALLFNADNFFKAFVEWRKGK